MMATRNLKYASNVKRVQGKFKLILITFTVIHVLKSSSIQLNLRLLVIEREMFSNARLNLKLA